MGDRPTTERSVKTDKASTLARLRELVAETLKIQAEHPDVEWSEESLDSFAVPIVALLEVCEAARAVAKGFMEEFPYSESAPITSDIGRLVAALENLEGGTE